MFITPLLIFASQALPATILSFEDAPGDSIKSSYEYYDAQAGLIDELRLGFGNFFLVDDLELTAVPVPAAAWLFSTGLIALFGIARRRP